MHSKQGSKVIEQHYIICINCHKKAVVSVLTSVSLKIEPLQYIATYYNGSIFNETDFIIDILAFISKVAT